MKYLNLVFAKTEYDYIKNLLEDIGSRDVVHQSSYEKLRKEMLSAKVLDDNEVPDDVVRLNSWIDVKTPLGYVKGYQLVIPKHNDPKQKKISILTPMGTAVLGYAAGDKLSWTFPSGEQEITIEKVYSEVREPESKND